LPNTTFLNCHQQKIACFNHLGKLYVASISGKMTERKGSELREN